MNTSHGVSGTKALLISWCLLCLFLVASASELHEHHTSTSTTPESLQDVGIATGGDAAVSIPETQEISKYSGNVSTAETVGENEGTSSRAQVPISATTETSRGDANVTTAAPFSENTDPVILTNQEARAYPGKVTTDEPNHDNTENSTRGTAAVPVLTKQEILQYEGKAGRKDIPINNKNTFDKEDLEVTTGNKGNSDVTKDGEPDYNNTRIINANQEGHTVKHSKNNISKEVESDKFIEKGDKEDPTSQRIEVKQSKEAKMNDINQRIKNEKQMEEPATEERLLINPNAGGLDHEVNTGEMRTGAYSNGTTDDSPERRPLDKQGWLVDTLDITVVPVITFHPNTDQPSSTDPTVQDKTTMTVEFHLHVHHLILDLHPTRDLLAASYVTSDPTDKEEEDEKDGKACEYQGQVRGQPGSWVAVSICGGLRGVIVVLDRELLVEPLASPSIPSSASLRQRPHRVYSAALLQLTGSCGVKTTNERVAATHKQTADDSSHRGRRALRGGAFWNERATRFVELVMVADTSFYRRHGAQTRARCRAIVNIVNAMYRPLGIVVVLSGLVVWHDRDEVPVLSDHEQTLVNIKTYRQTILKEKPHWNNDNTMLITDVDFIGDTVGYATVSGMCSPSGSAGVVQDNTKAVGVVAQTLAHEMGHNFGMNHTENTLGCHCPGKYCVMAGTGSTRYRPEMSWSTCSKQDLANGLQGAGFECLRNVPERVDVKGNCGDGIVQDGEECDCGPQELCDNRCCIADTCKLAVNATCASGSCCDTETCKLSRTGLVCRAIAGDCDLPEFCTGDSEYCPGNFYKGDGADCLEGKGHCYQGRCGSRDDRCLQVWGAGVSVAHPACNQNLNVQGKEEGNCGFTVTTTTHDLKKCSKSDAMCGSLHCVQQPTKAPKLPGQYSYGWTSLKGKTCNYIIAKFTIPGSHWLTPDGAGCGEGKMCVSQQCVEVRAISGEGSACASGCSGRGVCNNRGNCHCDAGFAPPYCSRKGLGGSLDSNSFENQKVFDPVVEAAFILAFILLGVVILVCCLWGKLRAWWEGKGRQKTNPCCASCLDSCCCPAMDKFTNWILTVKPISSKHKHQKEATHFKGEQKSMICQADPQFSKDSHTKSWGVANEKLVTEVVGITPKSSPDISRKIHLPGTVLVPHHNSEEVVSDRPTYFQSLSVDSGCVSDVEECVVKKPLASQMSMTSLITAFKRTTSQTRKTTPEKETSMPRTFGSQKSMPLSRFVVDPLVGSRSSRQEMPPPDHMNPSFNRSVSTDVIHSGQNRPGQRPPPPPMPALKPNKSQDMLSTTASHRNKFEADGKKESNSTRKWDSNGNLRGNDSRNDSSKTKPKVSMMPPNKSKPSPQRTSPARAAPGPPPQLAKKFPPKPRDTSSKTDDGSKNLPNIMASNTKSTVNARNSQVGNAHACNSANSQKKVPLMPPLKKTGRSLGGSSNTEFVKTQSGNVTSPQRGPMLPPNNSTKSSISRPTPTSNPSNVAKQGRSVKDLARQLEQ